RLEGRDGLRSMIGNGAVDMHEIDLGVGEHVLVFGITLGHAESFADHVQLSFGALTDGVHVGTGMALINGNKLGPKAQTNNGYVEFARAHASLLGVAVESLD